MVHTPVGIAPPSLRPMALVKFSPLCALIFFFPPQNGKEDNLAHLPKFVNCSIQVLLIVSAGWSVGSNSGPSAVIRDPLVGCPCQEGQEPFAVLSAVYLRPLGAAPRWQDEPRSCLLHRPLSPWHSSYSPGLAPQPVPPPSQPSRGVPGAQPGPVCWSLPQRAALFKSILHVWK